MAKKSSNSGKGGKSGKGTKGGSVKNPFASGTPISRRPPRQPGR